jgi:orotate phosphoribosyltransferase
LQKKGHGTYACNRKEAKTMVAILIGAPLGIKVLIVDDVISGRYINP